MQQVISDLFFSFILLLCAVKLCCSVSKAEQVDCSNIYPETLRHRSEDINRYVSKGTLALLGIHIYTNIGLHHT